MDDLAKSRLEYATKWFEYHAGQRVSMFNYFLITVGILTNAYALLVREGLTGIAAGVAFIGVIISAVFMSLDVRNRQLTHFAEDVLRKIERDQLFADFKDTKEGKEIQLGMIFRETVEPKVCWALKHRFLIRCTEGLMLTAFLIGAIYGLVHQESKPGTKVIIENRENNSVTVTPVKP